jgi:hypothetical protein
LIFCRLYRAADKLIGRTYTNSKHERVVALVIFAQNHVARSEK